jgi:hypothetical protein
MVKVACEKEAAVLKYTLNNRSDLREKFLTDEDFLNALHECVTDEIVINIRSSLTLQTNFIRREKQKATECNNG